MTERVLELLEELEFDPLRELVTLYRDPKTDRRTKVRIATELAQFVAPKLKAIDVQATNSSGMAIHLMQYGPKSIVIEIDGESPESFRINKTLSLTQ